MRNTQKQEKSDGGKYFLHSTVHEHRFNFVCRYSLHTKWTDRLGTGSCIEFGGFGVKSYPFPCWYSVMVISLLLLVRDSALKLDLSVFQVLILL